MKAAKRIRALSARSTVIAVAIASLVSIVGGADAGVQQDRLVASDGTTNDHFGRSVALSDDTAIIGAYTDDTAAAADAGSAYVFTRADSAWTQQAKLVASDGAESDWFGSAVTISGDTAIVGAPRNDSWSGSAYVFTRSGSFWAQQAKLVAPDATASLFGTAVALAGVTAVVGTPSLSGDRAAYVFTRSGATWTQQAKLVPSDGSPGGAFGVSVALDGDTAVVGAQGIFGTVGSAYVFTRSGSIWTEQAKLLASDGAAGDEFGVSVAVSEDTALVGAWQDDTAAGLDVGSAYVFTRSGSSWTQQVKLVTSDEDELDWFGYSLALGGDTAVIGKLNGTLIRVQDVAFSDAGSAYVFRRSGSTWTEEVTLEPQPGDPSPQFGTAVALSGDTAVIGAPSDITPGGLEAGSAYVFVGLGCGALESAALTAIAQVSPQAAALLQDVLCP